MKTKSKFIVGMLFLLVIISLLTINILLKSLAIWMIIFLFIIIGLIIPSDYFTLKSKANRNLPKANRNRYGTERENEFGADWIRANIRNRNVNPIPVPDRPQRDGALEEIQERLREFDRPMPRMQREDAMREIERLLELRHEQIRRIPNIPNMPAYMQRSPAKFEKKINEYITLRFEHNRTIIYVAGRRIIQCVHLILNIPEKDVPMYDEINSIDEAADIYHKQGRILGHMAHIQGAQIPPEQEFWGHCSNIQAWVENDYDTRILMSNLSFPLLRELTRAGDPVAKRVYKEEIAQRLESGYPSVVQYLLSQGYLGVFSSEEFKTILEGTAIIKNLSATPNMLFQFLRSCASKFPSFIEEILYSILKLQNGKQIILSMIQKGPRAQPFLPFPFRPSLMYHSLAFSAILKTKLESLFLKVEEESIREDISECIEFISNSLKKEDIDKLDFSSKQFGNLNQRIDLGGIDLGGMEAEERARQIRAQIIEHEANRANNLGIRRQIVLFRNRCAYCGREIPPGQEVCDWCGHRRRDDDDFFPFPYIFRDPGGGGGSMKGGIAIPIKVKSA